MSFHDFLKTNSMLYKESFSIPSALSENQILSMLNKEKPDYNDFLCLLSPAAVPFLSLMAQKARQLTNTWFGKTIQLYVPLYLSNECQNQCLYCGFNKMSDIKRKTLTKQEAIKEYQHLKKMGFDNILLLTGESPNIVDTSYLTEMICLARDFFSSVSLEIYPAGIAAYKKFIQAGATGLTLYQETYHAPTYKKVHLAGRKKNYLYRLNSPDRALTAGFRRMGVGALLGLFDWRYEMAMLGLHTQYLQKKYWRSEIAVSFPRLRYAHGNKKKKNKVTDQDLVQMILAIRLFLPSAGITLSTREPSSLRDHLIKLGVTQMSAASKTNPGGYSGGNSSGEQFSIADHRSLKTIMKMLEFHEIDPALKNWSYDFQGVKNRK
ncbi:MAG: 2-iminoacetate synthase ThiH [Candidatus Margulisbacteria bacterium]|nr:2-iminoacetate synthase ThiH [Candidatus Margulisiibacteriota bacterium]